MKKFNADEFIWFLIQSVLIILMAYLRISGKVTYFISGKMVVYFTVSIFILIIYVIAQIPRIFTVRSRNEITNKFIPLVGVIILTTVVMYIVPNYKSLKASTMDETIDVSAYDDLLVIDNDNYDILYDIGNNHEKYDGRVMEMEGFICRDNGEIYVGREVVSCCQSDKSLIQVRIRGISSIRNGTWIKIVGKIGWDDSLFLECIEYKKVSEPAEIYYHEDL